MWDSGADRSVLRVLARPAADGVETAFDLSRYRDLATVAVTPDEREHVVLSDGYRRVRLDIEDGSVRRGPVHLTSLIGRFDGIEPQILTLRRLVALCRRGRFVRALHPRERQAPRWILALRAHDALQSAAPQREIAQVLFSPFASASDWRLGSDFLRLRIQRLVRIGRSMVNGGYWTLLR